MFKVIFAEMQHCKLQSLAASLQNPKKVQVINPLENEMLQNQADQAIIAFMACVNTFYAFVALRVMSKYFIWAGYDIWQVIDEVDEQCSA